MYSTQGIKYAGSKLKLLPNILSTIKELDVSTILDGFSGTTRVGQLLSKNRYTVISSDISEWSYIFGRCYLKNTKSKKHYRELIDHLNSLSGYSGWFTEQYGGLVVQGKSAVQAGGLKKLWQVHNTKKLDAIRNEIDNLNLSANERAVLLTSLILALDKVDKASLGCSVCCSLLCASCAFERENSLNFSIPAEISSLNLSSPSSL